jgi:hypothetical protein
MASHSFATYMLLVFDCCLWHCLVLVWITSACFIAAIIVINPGRHILSSFGGPFRIPAIIVGRLPPVVCPHAIFSSHENFSV